MGGGAVVDQMKWTVTGKLVETAEETYLMSGLTATGPDGSGQLEGVTPDIVEPFKTEPVKLHVTDATHFSFSGESTDQETRGKVNAFFGGNYTKADE
jgi:hypothetical protein